MGVAISIHKNSTEGVSWIMAFFAFYTSYSFLVRPFSCDTELRLCEIMMYSISILAMFAWGLVDFWIRFDFSPEEHNEGNYFLIWYCLFIPFVLLCTTFLYRWYRNEWEFDGFVLTIMPLTLEWGIVLLVCCYLFIGVISGSIFTGIVAIIIYSGFMVFIYYKNNGRIPRKWGIFNF